MDGGRRWRRAEANGGGRWRIVHDSDDTSRMGGGAVPVRKEPVIMVPCVQLLKTRVRD